MSYLRSGHSLSAEMGIVHSRMIAKYNMRQDAQKDIARAKKMEQYLRAFKSLGTKTTSNGIKPTFQINLETEALQSVAEQVSNNLNLHRKGRSQSIFRWSHFAGKRAGVTGVDDVFEAELAQLLEVAAAQAVNNFSGDTGVQVLGRVSGNIAEASMQALKSGINDVVSSSSVPSDLINMPTARAIKTDVQGYSSQFLINADIKPQWREFLHIFSGARMTVKNYSSKTQYDTIRLGKTAPQKAVMASLDNLGYGPKQSAHIYYHLINSIPEESEHILHLRFQYELGGGGLYSDGTKLDEADFFIYNDPHSTNVWVRSTKAMIADMFNYISDVGDPLRGEIKILKSSFT